ncbi:glycerophosphodiester phosphodiesterase [Natrinema limicola]|uniref:Glycerophosphoryl diester phosphodiesterase n=1 Tax=Natrinema limicola JCM 13563 TaxID=1230457 RepID=M0C113_9EURY|nr:glycerophosphodiester phosphodiesterase [Natrinema limicola]ELZ16002.1 glycerophosphoryl diester phosphodiesterase [Natrinema limicola JCM 13563]
MTHPNGYTDANAVVNGNRDTDTGTNRNAFAEDQSSSPAVRRPPGALPRVIAHRGFADDYPENTTAAFRRAARYADAVEIDVRRCGSGELVAFHDATLDRVTDASGRVDETPLSTLRNVDVLGTGQGIPTLREAIAAIPSETDVTVELKEPVVEDALEVLDVDNEVVVSSLDQSILERVRARGGPPTALVPLPGTGGIQMAAEAGCSAVHPRRATVFLRPGYVERANRAGLAVNVWPVRDAVDAARLAAIGVDGIAADSAGLVHRDGAFLSRMDGKR